jgi:4'-phosphopantetheinyl transferase
MLAAASNIPRRISGLSARDVHIWSVRVSAATERLGELAALLSADELDRADRFQLRQPRMQFVVGRASLRQILAAYLDEHADALRFNYGAQGKPELTSFPRLHFSVSHSEDVVLIAVADKMTIGVDVERIRPNVSHDEIAQQYFSAAEASRLSLLPEPQRRRAFFRYWTTKEATVKAMGGGLTIPLDSIELAPASAGGPRNVRQRDSESAKAWFAYDLDVPNDYAATLAAPSSDLGVTTFEHSFGA